MPLTFPPPTWTSDRAQSVNQAWHDRVGFTLMAMAGVLRNLKLGQRGARLNKTIKALEGSWQRHSLYAMPPSFHQYKGVCGRVERSCAVFRSALCSPFAPAFRFRECHSIRPCTAQSLLPHRSLPAGLPHKPLHTVLHHLGIEGHQARGPWERVPRFIAQKPRPGETASLAPAVEPLKE